MDSTRFKHHLLAVSIISIIFPTLVIAQTNYVSGLETIEVTAQTEEEKKVAQVVKTADQLSKEMVSDSRDLVRFETGVTVVETGRFGSSGYAIRGVDENRVGIAVDGLRQAEALSSQGFKELFEGYGNFNNTRNSVEMEHVKTATITKGADSISSGSGALGGSVLFKTKDARDYLQDKDYHLGFKTGYQSMNNQKLNSLTAAGRYKWADALVIHTKRDRHEIENYNYDSVYASKEEELQNLGRTREKADPYHIETESTLVKLGVQPSENHRFSVAYDDSKTTSDGEDLSYSLRTNSYSDAETYGERLTHDESHRRNIQFVYENTASNVLWDSAKLSYSNQKIKNKARTDEYCRYSTCVGVQNPNGFHLDDSTGVIRTLDAYNGEISITKPRWSYIYTNSQGEKISNVRLRDVNNFYLDCSKIDCNKKMRVFVEADVDNNNVYQFEDRDINSYTTADGRKYGEIPVNSKEVTNWGFTYTQTERVRFIAPQSDGFQTNNYKDRDLNSDTKQLNLDLNKQFSLWNTQHQLKYGGLFDRTKKSMVDQDGFTGGNIQWWADLFLCKQDGQPLFDRWPSNCSSPRSNTGAKQSYLVPVQATNTAFYLGDHIRFNDWLGFDAHYRYDRVKLKPSYDPSVPVPKGMIAGIFVPLPDNAYGPNAPCGYNTECMDQNLAQNLAVLLQNKNYRHHSYSFGLTLDPLDWLKIQAKYANGFRAPTADEVYMTFKHPSFSIAPNINLEPETAKTQEIAVTFHQNRSFLTLNVFKTDYKNFIDLAYLERRPVEIGSVLTYPFYQSINRNQAKVTGFEVNSRLDLEELYSGLAGFHIGYKLTHQRGRMDNDIPMNAIQPKTSVFNLGYSTADDKYGFNLYATHVSEKKAKDTYNMYWQDQQNSGMLVQGQPVTDSTIAWRNDGYTVFDAIFHIRPWKNLTLTSGIYNLTNEKYMTWDSARSIRSFGTLNLIDQNTGAGMNRFYAPERNYRITAEFTF